MGIEINRDISVDDDREVKPAYQRPMLTELSAEETASGVYGNQVENSTYS